jgi:hypothetical protein
MVEHMFFIIFTSITSYSKHIHSMNPQEVFSYPMVSPKVPTTLMTLNSYPMCHHGHSFKSKNGRKWLKTGFWWYLLPKPLILHTDMFYGPTCGVQLSYGITQGAYYTQDPIWLPYRPPRPVICEQKRPKTVENRFLIIFTSESSYSTHKFVLWANKWCSIIKWYH